MIEIEALNATYHINPNLSFGDVEALYLFTGVQPHYEHYAFRYQGYNAI